MNIVMTLFDEEIVIKDVDYFGLQEGNYLVVSTYKGERYFFNKERIEYFYVDTPDTIFTDGGQLN